MTKSRRLKLSLFDQSSVIDAAISKKLLQEKGFKESKLETPVLYRGDSRSPDVIFKEGFIRKMAKPAAISLLNESQACIATTKQLTYAVGFADTTHYITNKIVDFGWVYVLYADKGFDLTTDENTHNKKIPNFAKYVDEVVLLHIPKENVIAAFKIKVTHNKMSSYYQKQLPEHERKEDIVWQIPVIDVRVNLACRLATENLGLFHSLTFHFKSIHQKGYYRIPWSPYPEETNTLKMNAHTLTLFQQEALAKGYASSVEDAKRFTYEQQVVGLHLGFTEQEVFSEKLMLDDKRKEQALKANVALDTLQACSIYEAYGLLNGLPYSAVKDLRNFHKVTALVLGFSRDVVNRNWTFDGIAGRMFFDVIEKKRTVEQVNRFINQHGYYA